VKYKQQNRGTIPIAIGMGVVLKELKECRTALKIIRKKAMIKPIDKLEYVYKETEELIAIVAKSITTAQKNKKITE
jgi:four helix bundle protein